MNRTSLLTAAAVACMSFAGLASAQTTPAPSAAAPAAPAATPAAPAASSASAAAPATPGAPATAQVKASGDIIQTAQAAGQFNTFLKAVEATNLTQVLKNNKNLTVFAPTDAAFAALPPGKLDELMSPAGRAELQKILTYHVINATVDSGKIKGARGPVQTVAGSDVLLDGSGAALKVNDATIVQADVRPTNGTIHVIDKVLSPGSGASAAASPSAGASASASPGADASASASTTAEPSAAQPSTSRQ